MKIETVARSAAEEYEHTHPFLKWAGGKRRIMREVRVELLRAAEHSSTDGRFIEPFVGGGSVFLDQVVSGPLYAGYILADTNERLVRTYAAIRDDVDKVIRRLKGMVYEKETFEKVRAQNVDAMSDVGVAVWMIYLNRTCFNGLYRVNKDNRFNVPFGDYKNPTLFKEDNLRAVSKALQGVEIVCEDFETLLDTHARKGDVVYCDPPYVPLSKSSDFTKYDKDGFTMKDQERLRDVAARLRERGVHVVLSNSSAAEPLYADEKVFHVRRIDAPRSVGAGGATRKKVEEILVRTRWMR